MTLHFPKPSFADQILKRLGKPRAVYVENETSLASRTAVKEPFLRALLRKPGQPPPEGWVFCDEPL